MEEFCIMIFLYKSIHVLKHVTGSGMQFPQTLNKITI